MLIFTIQQQQFKMPETWEEITLGKMIEFRATVQMPTSMQTVMSANDAGTAVDAVKEVDAEEFDAWMQYKIDTVAFWSGMSQELVEQTRHEDMLALFQNMINIFADNTVPDVDKFEYKGDTWILPKLEEIELLGTRNLQPQITVGEVCEAMQFERMTERLKRDDWEALPGLLGILVRKEGELFDRGHVVERYQFWKDAPMSIVWLVSFFLYKQSVQYIEILRQFGASSNPTTSAQGRNDTRKISVGTDFWTRWSSVGALIGRIARRNKAQSGPTFTRRRSFWRSQNQKTTSRKD